MIMFTKSQLHTEREREREIFSKKTMTTLSKATTTIIVIVKACKTTKH